jgi:hypothetical protein
MISSKFGAIAFIAAIGVASPAFAQSIYGPLGGAGSHNNPIAVDYTYNARPGWPVRNPDPWANNYRLKHHHVTHHLPSKAQ